MAKNATEKTDTNNLESGNYTIVFGSFDKDEKGKLEFPPNNAKKMNSSKLNQDILVIKAESNRIIPGKDGNKIRVTENGRVLTGSIQQRNKTKRSDEQRAN